jgi:outer membrane protein assembly factor BamB
LGKGYGIPSVAQGRLFQFERLGGEATLTVLESETGRFLWKFSYPSDFADLYGYDNGPRTSPVIDGDRVYLFGAEGMLYCLSLQGKVIWKVDTREKFGVVQNFFGVGSTPLIEGDLLIVPVGGSPAEDQITPPGQLNRVRGNGSGVVAFDKRTGRVRYQFSDELASYASPVAATIDNRRWCFVFARGGLLGFEPASGRQDFFFPWRAKNLESVNAATPVVIGDQVFISETYGPGSALLRVRPGKCDVVWSDADRPRNKAMQLHWNTPIHKDGYLYGSSGRHEGNAELRCIEVATGEIKWSEPDLGRCSLLYVDGHLICQSENGTLRLLKLNPERYELISECVLVDADGNGVGLQRGRHMLTAPAWAAPILSHGLLYVRGRDRLVCLEAMRPEAISMCE